MRLRLRGRGLLLPRFVVVVAVCDLHDATARCCCGSRLGRKVRAAASAVLLLRVLLLAVVVLLVRLLLLMLLLLLVVLLLAMCWGGTRAVLVVTGMQVGARGLSFRRHVREVRVGVVPDHARPP